MTIHTLPWPTDEATTIGDSNKNGTSAEQARRLFRAQMGSVGDLGVRAGYLNELAVTTPAAEQINVDTGGAFVYGTYLNNDAAVNVPLTPVAADTAGLVYAQVDWTGGSQYTGSIGVNQQASGNTTVPTPSQTDLTQWQIPLASYILASTGSGGAVTLTDLRQFVPRAANIIARQGGSDTDWATPGTTNYKVGNNVEQIGVNNITVLAANNAAFLTITFPVAFGGTPNVVLEVQPFDDTPLVGSTSQASVNLSTGSPSSTAFTCVVARQLPSSGTDESHRVHWRAVGPPA